MSRVPANAQHLRLVGMKDSDGAAWQAEQARLAIVKENRVAAHAGGFSPDIVKQIDARDPRWVLAMQTQARLQGAVLSPERRDELMKSGRKMGLRPFEANLVIAIVQDRARSGGRTERSATMLSLVRGTEAQAQPIAPAVWPKWFAALAAAAAVAAVLIRWFAG
jgi:hypothetical protein